MYFGGESQQLAERKAIYGFRSRDLQLEARLR